MNQQTAQGLASLGRGPDSMLVHMAPGEVKSLQQLAMAHGGSLTINPETGLPEAGFLSSLLPMLIGGGLSIASGGALTPLMAAMMTGGGYAAATGSLRKGLMAGLGAYGGAGLGSALAGAGGANLVAAGTPVPNPGAAMAAGAGDATANVTAAGAMNPANFVGPGVPSAEFINPSNLAGSSSPGMFGNASANFGKASAGAQGLLSEQGRNAFMSSIQGPKGLMQAGMMAAAPMMMETTTKQPEMKTDKNMGQRYQYSPGTVTPTPSPDVPGYGDQSRNFGKEQRYFNPVYTPIDNDAARKLYGFASGGPVEDMSNANSIGMNTGYPQSDIRAGAYATPYQQPISRNVVTGAQDAAVNPYSGQAQFAEGGDVGGYTYDPVTQMYTKKAGEGATMVSPRGGTSGASGSSGGGVDAVPSDWDNMTPTEKAEFYQDPANSFLAGLTQLGQKGFAHTSLGMALNALNPGLQNMHSQIALGITPQQTFRASELSRQGGVDAAFAQQEAQQQSLNQALNDMSGRQESQMNSGEGIGGGDISGQSEGTPAIARGGLLAQGGISHLGDYSDGGRLLRGPGDGISDSIPAMIGKKRPARLADGEFVVPARIVSELGNGSTEAGARKLYAMMDRVQKARGKTVGKGKVAANSRSAKYLPA
jgi:hypothetical protein